MARYLFLPLACWITPHLLGVEWTHFLPAFSAPASAAVDMTAVPHGIVPPLGASCRSSNPTPRMSLGENIVQFLDG